MTPWLLAAAAAVLCVVGNCRRPAAGVPALPSTAPTGAGWALFVALLVWSGFLVWIAISINTPGNPTPPPQRAPAADGGAQGQIPAMTRAAKGGHA